MEDWGVMLAHVREQLEDTQVHSNCDVKLLNTTAPFQVTFTVPLHVAGHDATTRCCSVVVAISAD
jgi:hypothetical protein